MNKNKKKRDKTEMLVYLFLFVIGVFIGFKTRELFGWNGILLLMFSFILGYFFRSIK